MHIKRNPLLWLVKPRYRNSHRIIGDVLGITENSGIGINHTALLRKANLSHASLRKIVDMLLSAGLVSVRLTDGQRVYCMTPKGRHYLGSYRQFSAVSEAFGIQR